MFWLLALGVAVLLLGSGGGHREPPNSLDETWKKFLSPEELAELSAIEHRAVQARHELDSRSCAHAEGSRLLERARRRLSAAWWGGVCGALPACIGLAFLYRPTAAGQAPGLGNALVSIALAGIASASGYSIYATTQRRNDARRQEAFLRHQEDDARQRSFSLASAVQRARDMAADCAKKRREALVRAKQERKEEERRGEEIAAWVEKEQAAAARAVEDERRQFSAFVKEALYHALRIAPDPKRFLAVHGDALLAKRRRIRGAYVSGHVLGSTADECLRLAERALRELPHEVAYWYPHPKDRTATKLAHAFRAYSGAFREVLLPLALERQAAREQRRQLPVKVPRRKRTELERLLAAMPPDVCQRAVAGATGALAVNALTEFQQKALDAERASLERRGVRQELIQRQLETMKENLEKSASEYAGEHGLISGELE